MILIQNKLGKKMKIDLIKLSLKKKSTFSYGSRNIFYKKNFINSKLVKRIIFRKII